MSNGEPYSLARVVPKYWMRLNVFPGDVAKPKEDRMKKQLCKSSLSRLCVSVSYMDDKNLEHVLRAIELNRVITIERKRPLAKRARAAAKRGRK